jgi:hypothetical protein
MSLEEEARTLAAEIAADHLAMADRAAREREKRILEETPSPPSWTAELIAMIEAHYTDKPVYRIESSNRSVGDHSYTITNRYALLGRGWGLMPKVWNGSWREMRTAILLRDGNLYSGSPVSVKEGDITRHIGFPPGTKVALVAGKIMTNATQSEDMWRKLYGIDAAAAILAGTVKAGPNGLTWDARP